MEMKKILGMLALAFCAFASLTANNNECCGCAITKIKQSDLPFTIISSGAYILDEDVSQSGNAAITINSAENVTLDLCSHKIFVNNGPAQAIKIVSSRNVTIKNGMLRGTTGFLDASTDLDGIRCETVDGLSVENVYFSELRHGIFGPYNQDNSMFNITKCQFVDIYGRMAPEIVDQQTLEEYLALEWIGTGIGGFRQQGIHVTQCDFNNLNPPDWLAEPQLPTNAMIVFGGFEFLDFGGLADNGFVSECNFINHNFAFAWWPEGDTHGTLIVEKCNFTSSPQVQWPALQVCCSAPDCVCRSEIIRECTFKCFAPFASKQAEGIALPSAHSTLIENCVFSLPYNVDDGAYVGGPITIGNGASGSVYSNTTIRGCSFDDMTANHVAAYKGSALLIDNCQFSKALKNAVLLSGLDGEFADAYIKKCAFTNNYQNGVGIDAGVSGIVLEDNLFKLCKTGVKIDPAASKILINDSTFFMNESPSLTLQVMKRRLTLTFWP
jgi:hypothetical protein